MNKKNIDIKKTLLDNGIIIVLLLLVLITGITKDNFFSWNNLSNISVNTAARVIIAFGVSGCLITKGTDLSAGRMVGLASCIAGTLLQTADYSGKFFPNLGDMPVFGVLALCILICCIFGLINGIVIAYLNVPAFIGTLGMQLAVYGICLVYTNANHISIRLNICQIQCGKVQHIKKIASTYKKLRLSKYHLKSLSIPIL